MQFKIIVDVEDCPYRGKTDHIGYCNDRWHKCKHERGSVKCVSEYDTFEDCCPLVEMGCLIKE